MLHGLLVHVLLWLLQMLLLLLILILLLWLLLMLRLLAQASGHSAVLVHLRRAHVCQELRVVLVVRALALHVQHAHLTNESLTLLIALHKNAQRAEGLSLVPNLVDNAVECSKVHRILNV
jgi:hypothetical protein